MEDFIDVLWDLFLSFLAFISVLLIASFALSSVIDASGQAAHDFCTIISYLCAAVASCKVFTKRRVSSSGQPHYRITNFIADLIRSRCVHLNDSPDAPSPVKPSEKASADDLSQFIHRAQWYANRSDIDPDAQAVIDNFRDAVDARLNAPPPNPLTREEYAEIRETERQWLESHYDFSTIESIEAIPEQKDLPRPPGDGVTGDVYYYLHYLARISADNLRYDYAIACQKKSNALIKFRYGNWSGRRECYYLVKLYARSGMIDEAYAEKASIEQFYGIPSPGSRDDRYAKTMIPLAVKQGRDERDFSWLMDNLPDLAPKSKNAFCRMRSQNTQNYQNLKRIAAELGREI